MIRIAVDAMGGDNAPECNVKGAAEALKADENIEIILTGDEEKIKAILASETYDEKRLRIVPTTEVIETGDEPVVSVRSKKDSSLVVGLKMLKTHDADAFVSAGSSGAVLVGAQFTAGRLKGIRRSPLAIELPNMNGGKTLLLDCGANVDAKPDWLVQYAVIGTVYAKSIMGIQNPRVGILNIGVEEEKGNDLTRQTYQLLKEQKNINFIGNAEARDILADVADVIVCDAFAGNIALKTLEGTAKTLLKMIKSSLMSSTQGKIGGLLIKPSLKGLVSTFDMKESGGAPMLGLSGLVMKAHGNSTEIQIRNAILQCVTFSEQGLTEKIAEAVKELA